MAIAGGAKPCIRMQVIGGELITYPQGMAQGVVDKLAEAVDRLARGEVVHVAVYGGLAIQVRQQVEQRLQEAR